MSIDEILQRCDRGERVADIAAAVGLGDCRVYQVLRKHRPDRPRAKQGPRSDRPRLIREMFATGMRQSRIAAALGVSRQYVSAGAGA